MEIIQERLEREYDLDLITTAPSVIYKVIQTDQSVVMVDNPSQLPEPQSIAQLEEPYVAATIMVPKEYVGAVMEVAQEKRGTFVNMEYMTETRVTLKYDLPLSEIVYDFFDQLKTRTKGYASLDYEMIGYKPSNLVKLDVLVNGEVVDALSCIIHKDKAYRPRTSTGGRSLGRSFRGRCSKCPSRQLSAIKSLPGKPSKLCVRASWTNAMAVISAGSASCWKNKKKAKSA